MAGLTGGGGGGGGAHGAAAAASMAAGQGSGVKGRFVEDRAGLSKTGRELAQQGGGSGRRSRRSGYEGAQRCASPQWAWQRAGTICALKWHELQAPLGFGGGR